MKKIIYTTILVITIVFLSEINAYSYDLNEVWDGVDETTKEYLYDLGIDELSFEELFELTPTRVINFLYDLALNKCKGIISRIVKIIVVLLITSVANSFFQDRNKSSEVLNLFCSLIILSFVLEPVCRILTDTVVSIKTSTIFINSYLPIMTAIIIAAKSPALAFTYNSFSLFLSSVITTFADKILIPLISALMTFTFLSSISLDNFKERIFNSIKKIVVIVLSLFSTIYTGVLTAQSLLSNTSDSIALKGIKFITGTFIPIVGGNVSEAISSVFSSFMIMKNTLGVFVIIVIILINLPVIIELLVWYVVLGICSIISSLFGLYSITDIFDRISSILSLMNIILLFITVILIISTGIIIVMGK